MKNQRPADLPLPGCLADVDADYLTTLLRHQGVLSPMNGIISLEESDVGMTDPPSRLTNGRASP